MESDRLATCAWQAAGRVSSASRRLGFRRGGTSRGGFVLRCGRMRDGAELAGGGCVQHVAGVVRAHLEQHAHLELAQDLVREISIEVVHGVAPGDQVDAQDGPFAQDRVEVIRRRRFLVVLAREAEFVLACGGGRGIAAGRGSRRKISGPSVFDLLAALHFARPPRRGSR